MSSGAAADRSHAELLCAREAAVLRRDRWRRHRVLETALRPPAVHRLGHHRPRGDGRGGAEPVSGDAGARRQGAGHRLRRLRHPPRGRTHPVHQVPQRGPDLHHRQPCLAARRTSRGLCRACAPDRAATLREPRIDRLHQHHRPPRLRAPDRGAGGGARAWGARDTPATGPARRRGPPPHRAAHRPRRPIAH